MEELAKQDDWTRITLRLPGDLHERLTKSAGPRSVNAEIVERLDRSFYQDTEDSFLEKLATGRFIEPLPKGLAGRIQASAEESGRSVEDEVIYRLEDGFSSNRSERREELLFYQNLLAGAVDAAGDRIPEGMQQLLKPLRPVGDHPNYFHNLLSQIEGAADGGTGAKVDRGDLEHDVHTVLNLMDTELAGGEIGDVPKMRTALGDRLSQAIGDRTAQAMKLVVEKLREAGLLRGNEREASQAVDAQDLFKKRA